MDEQLRILKAAERLPALDALDERILRALADRQREAFAARRLMALAALVSLGGGIVAGGAISSPDAARSLTPLGPPGVLAPSALLDTQ